jgi:hypothetical protein
MDEQKSAIPNGCPEVPDGGLGYAPSVVGGGQELALFHQNLRGQRSFFKFIYRALPVN